MKCVSLRARALALAPLLAAALPACYTPGYNTYATPRTTPESNIGAGIHIQAAGYNGEIDHKKDQSYLAPTPPGVSGRLGLAERWDTGIRLGYQFPAGEMNSALYLGGDLKWLVLPGDALDVALNPGLGVTLLGETVVSSKGYIDSEGTEHWLLDAPIVTGINLHRTLVVVVSTGVVAGWYADEVVPLEHSRRGRLLDGIAPRVGLGLNVRAGARFAVHPEVTFVYSNAEDNERLIYTFGIAFQFGRLPRTLRTSQTPPPAPPESGGPSAPPASGK